jgi:F0F1-type ATP synthase assembly protein I
MNTDKSREGTNQKAKKQKAESKKAESRKQKAESRKQKAESRKTHYSMPFFSCILDFIRVHLCLSVVPILLFSNGSDNASRQKFRAGC